NTCPCWKADCFCSGYRPHPAHQQMRWTMCYDNHCPYHFAEKQKNQRWPKHGELSRRDQRRKTRVLEDTRRQQLAGTAYAKQLRTRITIGDHETVAMIDSGATGSFIHPRMLRTLGIKAIRKPQEIPLTLIDGDEASGGGLTHETGMIPMTIGKHHE